MVPGVATFIVALSAHTDVFGVGSTAMVGSMLVPPSCVIAGRNCAGRRAVRNFGSRERQSGAMVGGPPGVELHTVVDELPSGDAGDIVPVVLPTNVVGMVPNGIAGIIAVGRVVAVDGVIVAVVPGVGVETVLCLIDDVGTDSAVIGGKDRGGTVGSCGAGMVEFGKTLANDVSGWLGRLR
jgi:hypothetical protein